MLVRLIASEAGYCMGSSMEPQVHLDALAASCVFVLACMVLLSTLRGKRDSLGSMISAIPPQNGQQQSETAHLVRT